MKIEIDTEKDGERELRAAIALIEELLGGREHRARADQGADRSVRTPSVFDTVGATSSSAAAPQGQAGTPPQGLFAMFDTAPEQGSPKSEPLLSELKPYPAESSAAPPVRRRPSAWEDEDEEFPEIEPYN